MADRTEFLVYLLVDKQNRIHYVGRGTHGRATSHDMFDGNEKLARAFEDNELSLLVLDCETEHAMVVTEGALIDALTNFKPSRDLANRRLDKYRFSPSRVPGEFADRLGEAPLDPRSVSEIVGGPVLYVRVKDGPIPHEDRGVIDPLRPDPGAIANRIERSWYVDPWLVDWHGNPEVAPKVVVGLAGGSTNRYILGALEVPKGAWPEASGRGGQDHIVPWAKVGDRDAVTVEDIDAYGLCGRRMEVVRFGHGNKTEWAQFYNAEGERVPRP